MKLLKIPEPIECKILKRINRFVVEVEIDGIIRRAHINNTGRLEELLFEGNVGLCVKTDSPKTSHRLFAAKCESGFALIDTRFQMRAFEVASRHLDWLECRDFRRNVTLCKSKIDYLFCNTFVEVKSAALKKGKYAMYPDCPTERGRKHVSCLIDVVMRGGRGAIVFIASVPDVDAFTPNRDADPKLYRLLIDANRVGVELKSINLVYESKAVKLVNADLPVLI